ncbi:MAG TPA: imidazole glycerol phosphate synthase subunit HisH [Roseiflexaceae bacterium]|nr:imidazole glycerol phosphate synthase subunit HisH [Roseiflexaceae bacterium]
MTSTKTPITVIDYGAGNLPNAVRALAHAGAELRVTDDPAVVREARAVVFPGVGATRDTMDTLNRLALAEAIRERVRAGVPTLGICVGMQVLCEDSEEFGLHGCLGLVGGRVRRLPDGQKVPQIGWNQVSLAEPAARHPLFAGIPDQTDFYFVHSFYCDLADPALVAGRTEYGISFPSVLLRDTLAGVQFHPEKSGRWGLRLLANFVRWANEPTLWT